MFYSEIFRPLLFPKSRSPQPYTAASGRQGDEKMQSANVLTIKRSRIISPALYHLDLSQSNPGKIRLEAWAWMDLGEVATCVRDHLGEIVPKDAREAVFERFGCLNGCKEDSKPIVTWILKFDSVEYVINGKPPRSCAYQIYIPAQWGKAVVDLASRGVDQVLYCPDDLGNNLIGCIGGKYLPLCKRNGAWKILSDRPLKVEYVHQFLQTHRT